MKMKSDYELMSGAVFNADIDKLREILESGGDVNFVNRVDETILMEAIECCGMDMVSNENNNFEPRTPQERIVSENRRNIISLLVEYGADVNFKGEENCGVLFQAVLLKDTFVLEQLLLKGANPNFLMESGQTLYDWADIDYRHDAFDWRLPLDFNAPDPFCENKWLDYLDLCAEFKGVFKPDFLRVLRRFGAKKTSELEGDEFS